MFKFINHYNHMLKIIQSRSQESEQPSNAGQKWTTEEEHQLLKELNENIDIQMIAKIHNRRLGGIISRQKELAYKMHLNNINMEDIIKATKLDGESITEFITKKNYNNKKLNTEITPKNTNDITPLNIYVDILEIKSDIKELKIMITEIFELIKTKL